MFTIDNDLTINVTRGDILFFGVTAKNNETEETYTFQPGDVVRISVYGKKDCENVVLQKDFVVTSEAETVEIFLSKNETKISETISKPKDYWYEIELNPDTNPQTIIGYDDNGAKVFRLYPEGEEVPADDEEVLPEEIPIIDYELDVLSNRPVRNKAIARAIYGIRKYVDDTCAVEDISDSFIVYEFSNTVKVSSVKMFKQGKVISGVVELEVQGVIDEVGTRFFDIAQTYRPKANRLILPSAGLTDDTIPHYGVYCSLGHDDDEVMVAGAVSGSNSLNQIFITFNYICE